MARVIVWAGIMIFIAISSFFIGKFSGNTAEAEKKELKSDSVSNNVLDIRYVNAQNISLDTIDLIIKSKGRVSDGRAINITSEVQGKLIKGSISLKKGSNFKQGDLIARINNTEAELLLKARKSTFSNQIASILPDISIDYISNYNIWNKFYELVSSSEALPDLPTFRGSEKDFLKFKNFLTAKGIMTEYYSIRSEEERFRKYYIFAPFDGSIIDAFAEEGMVVNPGSTIIRVAKKGIKEIEVPVSVNSAQTININAIVDVITDKNKRIKGKVVRKGDYINPLTQSMPVFIDISDNTTNVISGEYVDIEINAGKINNSFELTRRALQKDQSIYIVKDSSLLNIAPAIEHISDNNVILSNLNEGDIIVIEPITNIKENQKIGVIIQK